MTSISETVKAHRPDLGPYEELYKHFHANPELSFLEEETARKIAENLRKFDAYEVFTGIGGHGLAAVLRNGPGKTILLRADIDGLPVQEQTGLPYASTKRMKDVTGVEKPVMHACGHDMHITSLLAAAEGLVSARDKWSGTVVLVFQPAEERGAGAKAMVEDGLYKKVPVPDFAISGHVVPFRAGVIGTKHGLVASSADSFHLNIPGRQSHASTPHTSLDPILQAAHTITRLQTIVSRETNPLDFAVVTVSSFHAGDAENIIPSHADLKLDVRAAVPQTRQRLLQSVQRIVEAEAVASGNPQMPTLTRTREFPFLFNDAGITTALEKTFSQVFEVGPHGYNADIPRLQGSEDFGILAESVGKPCCFFLYGSMDPETWDRLESEQRLEEVPGNHSPRFAPVVRPTLGVAVNAFMGSVLTFLGV
ncbi:metal-dependent amidase/aminoacylase/carboxypeptidase [Westerdykella ornata]|uniref:Metal-dependent amidase/aminoacylase/carboxypeptidase n=1 Tax=Westerdykella ornata TaxID=318751 RepID=A0A6A6JGF4_WESOR|nr:metal-dependent amidase/aminoacylase/carboxypeptidase [Westerdykella ornata]KAF2275058.1 metal-dependent amidase/aminoacylase/carboxypeptidase [Westerdykella ornata]